MTATPAPHGDLPADERMRELAANLADVRERVRAACDQARRCIDDVTVVVVTKTFPAADVVRLVGLGVQQVAENRDQEAAAKVAEVTERLGGRRGPTWHFVGQLQRNKARSVARYADVVHSVDRVPLVAALSAGAHAANRHLDVLVQVNLDPSATGRGGVPPADLPVVADAVAQSERLHLRGVMAVAPLGTDPRPAFDRLVALAARLRDDHPEATWVSAGMSGDLEAAVQAGATHLRVGSAVLGSRPSLR
ncbi:MAG TPA: YggS family pyridoxal phosphate-dependent enzyme [Actinomycetales bacterium]|nr:YggS family pyridoxal phosphate-dependent enzyme [Actinomycetales bacterium]